MDAMFLPCYDAGMRPRYLLPYIVIVIATTAAAEPNVPAGLPVFKHHSIVLDYKDLRYNPCNDVIIPSVIRTEHLDRPLGEYYLYYAPHNAPGGICLAYADRLEGPWKEYKANPIIRKDWPPHHSVSHVSGPEAVWIEEEQKLFLYYHGENDITRFASSANGIDFRYEGVAVTAGMFDRINEASYARVFRYTLPGRDNRWIMLFMGNCQGTRNIYLASSKDGRKWEPAASLWSRPRRGPTRSPRRGISPGKASTISSITPTRRGTSCTPPFTSARWTQPSSTPSISASATTARRWRPTMSPR
jgi:hypothetical protein